MAILDATFGRHRYRALAAELAHELCIPIHVVEVRCSTDVALARLARREKMGTDPSDAGPALHAQSVARFEPTTDDERVHVIHTDTKDWQRMIPQLASELR